MTGGQPEPLRALPLDSRAACLDALGASSVWGALLYLRMGACSVLPAKPSMERKPGPSPMGRWRCSSSRCPSLATRTVGQYL